MKYIIELEDKPVRDLYGENENYYKCKQMPYWYLSEGIVNGLTPYTEPDRKVIDLRHARDIENVAKMNYNEGAKDAWEFVSKFMWSLESDEILGMNIAHAVRDMTYQEAKTKYDGWSKQNIREGDEVIYNSRTKAIVLEPETKERYGTILTDDFATIVVSHDDLEKTGRHFSDIEELLKKMRGE